MMYLYLDMYLLTRVCRYLLSNRSNKWCTFLFLSVLTTYFKPKAWMWFSIKMKPSDDTLKILFQCGGILGIASAIGCFAFIAKKLEINHVIKKLLLFATVQQAFFSGTFLCATISIYFDLQNKLTCFLSFTSMVASTLGSQATISMISIIRYAWIINMQGPQKQLKTGWASTK